jgi:hypothetical protein
VPHYYFDVYDGKSSLDEYGVQLSDLDAAQVEALRLSAEILKEQPLCFAREGALRIEIRSHGDAVLTRLDLSMRLTTPLAAAMDRDEAATLAGGGVEAGLMATALR